MGAPVSTRCTAVPSLVGDIRGRLFCHVSEQDKFIALFKNPPSDRISSTGAALGSTIKETSCVAGLQTQEKDITNLKAEEIFISRKKLSFVRRSGL